MIGLGVGVGFLSGAAFGPVPPVVFGMLLIGWLVATRQRVAVVSILIIGGAITAGVWRGEPLPDAPLPVLSDDTRGLSGTVIGAPSTRSDHQTFFVVLEPSSAVAAGAGTDIRLYVTAPALPSVRPGDQVWMLGEIQPARVLASGFARYLRSNAAAGTLNAFSLRIEERASGWRQYPYLASTWYGRMIARAAPGDRGALLSGLVTGHDDALSQERKDAFQRTGTAHITAVSGSNLALLVTLATFSGRVTGLRRRLGWQVGVVVFLWGYALLAGFEPPVNRAAVVATGAVAAGIVGRRADALTLLAIGGAALVAIHPLVLWSISFQLSLAASAALALMVEPDDIEGWAGWLRAGLTATIAAQVATLPFALGAFGEVPLLAVPANLIVAPIASAAFVLAAGAGVVGLMNQTAGEFMAALAGVPAGWVIRAVDVLGGAWAPVIVCRTNALETTVVAAACAVAICLWSRDGHAWLMRTTRETHVHRRRLVVICGPMLAGLLVVLAITTRD